MCCTFTRIVSHRVVSDQHGTEGFRPSELVRKGRTNQAPIDGLTVVIKPEGHRCQRQKPALGPTEGRRRIGRGSRQRRVPPAWRSIRQDPTGNLLNAMFSATTSASSYLLAMRPDQNKVSLFDPCFPVSQSAINPWPGMKLARWGLI
jgi:hypothetical protein